MKQYLLLTLIIFSGVCSYAQTSKNSSAAVDTTEKPRTSLTLAALYGSNVSYYGQVSSQQLPFTLGYAKVSFPTGLWLSAQMYKLLNSESGFSGASATAGYSFNLSKDFSGDFSYSRSFFPDSSQLLQSANQDIASVGLDYDWQWLTTGLSADYVFGSESALYSTFNASKYIDLGISLSSKDYFTLEPGFEVVGGTQRFKTTTTNPPQPGGPPLIPPVLDNPLGKGNGKGKNIIKGREGETTTTTSTAFNLLSYTFTLPLAYNRANYTLEASYQGTVLSKSVSDSQKLQSFFNLGFYYIF
jgi:hypothetical protein